VERLAESEPEQEDDHEQEDAGDQPPSAEAASRPRPGPADALDRHGE